MRQGVRLSRVKRIRKASGAVYTYYRRADGGLVALPNLPENDPEFLRAYADAAAADRKTPRPAPGKTVDALISRYYLSRPYQDLAPSSRADRRRILEHIRDARGAAPVAGLATRHLQADVDALAPFAARNRLKAWRALCGLGLALGWMKDDPSREVRPPKADVEGHAIWSDEDLDAFRRRWPLGTAERLAFELLIGTGQRRSDVVAMGWQNLSRDGSTLSLRQQKTGKRLELPVGRDLGAALALCDRGRMTFLETAQGAARTAAGFGGWFRRACDAAGLAERSAHGLRHAKARLLAEAGSTVSEIAAFTGHESLSEVRRYTDSADQARLARSAAARLEREQNSGNSAVPDWKLRK